MSEDTFTDKPKIGINTGNRGKGRPKGALNKTTALLRDAVLKAAEDAGDGSLVDYLAKQAKDNPNAFLSLLGRVLPLQINADISGEVGGTWNVTVVKPQQSG